VKLIGLFLVSFFVLLGAKLGSHDRGEEAGFAKTDPQASA
jgi:hypothetical protein